MLRFLAGVCTGIVAVVLAGVITVSILLPSPDAPPPPPRPTPTALPTPAAGETVLGRVALTSVQVATPHGELTEVSASGQGVTFSDKGLRANQLTVDATLPFDTVVGQVGGDIELYAVSPTRAGVRTTVALLGQELRVDAVATVSAQDGQLVVTPETIDVGGPGWLEGAMSASVRRLVTIRHTIAGLPEGMRLVAVSVTQTGFRARLEGSQVSITR